MGRAWERQRRLREHGGRTSARDPCLQPLGALASQFLRKVSQPSTFWVTISIILRWVNGGDSAGLEHSTAETTESDLGMGWSETISKQGAPEITTEQVLGL